MIDERIIEREQKALMSNYKRQPVQFVRGEGAGLFDPDGRRYIDCVAGISTMNVGHSHPAVVAAVQEQAARLIHVSNLYYTEPMIALAEWIRDNSMGGRVFFCNSGTEAVEAALKLCRKHGQGRPEVVALIDSFHGRTYGALTLTGQPGKQDAFRPLLPGVVHVDRQDMEGLQAAVGPQTAAVFMEIIQGESGVHPTPPEMLRLARELCDRHGALLVFDEIQTGLARTGPTFAYQDLGIEPDVMTLAKSLGGGVPIGAITARPGIDATFQPGDHGSTFAAGPLACAAGLASTAVLGDPALQAHVREEGARFLEGLQGLVRDGLATEARGRGLMCGLDLPQARSADLVSAMLARGILVNATGPRTVRFLPPLVIGREDLDAVLAALRETIPQLTA
ncbi:MAG: aspartate aminotransferase family protein [Thermoleophilia bacterium]